MDTDPKELNLDELNLDELKVLMQNYKAYFSFAKSFENSLNTFNFSLEELTDEEIRTIRHALECLSGLLSDEKYWKLLEDDINMLSKSKNKNAIHIVFNSLSKIPPDLDMIVRGRRIKRTVLNR